jgi:hypothetical protein
MSNFALIQGNTVTQLFLSDPHLNADVRDVSGVPGIQVGWIVDANGQYQPPPTLLTWEAARQVASSELDQTMNICVRCLELQQPVPQDWIDYRNTLRGFRDSPTGDPTVAFPPRPAYPAGITPPPYFPAGVSVWPPAPPSSSTAARSFPFGMG